MALRKGFRRPLQPFAERAFVAFPLRQRRPIHEFDNLVIERHLIVRRIEMQDRGRPGSAVSAGGVDCLVQRHGAGEFGARRPGGPDQDAVVAVRRLRAKGRVKGRRYRHRRQGKVGQARRLCHGIRQRADGNVVMAAHILL